MKIRKNYQLCEKHFEEKYITKGGTRKRLFEKAIPTIFPHLGTQRVQQVFTESATVNEPREKVNILSGTRNIIINIFNVITIYKTSKLLLLIFLFI